MSLEKENHGRRRFQDPDENFGNMQNFWRVISRVKHPFPSHSRVTVSLAQTRSYLSPAFSALPTSPPLWLSRDLNALNRHFPSILLLTNSRVLWGSTWRQCSSVAPSARRTGCRQPGHSHGVRTMPVACLWGISQCSSSSPACCPFSSTNRILSYTYFLSFIGIPSHGECWWNGRRASAWMCQQGKAWLKVSDPGMAFPLRGEHHQSDWLTAHICQWLWIWGRPRGQVSSSKTLPQSKIMKDLSPHGTNYLEVRLGFCYRLFY